jgi:tetratricopeptide (TPR) repeat protein
MAPKRPVPRWLLAAALAALLIAGGAFFKFRKSAETPRTRPPLSLLIADFDNRTGDAVFDGALEPMLAIAMEGAPFITSYNRNTARRSAERLRPGIARLDEAAARLVAVREGINVILSGTLTGQSSGYSVGVKAIDAVTGKTVASAEVAAGDRQKVLATMSKLAVPLRNALGDATPEAVQLAAAETFTASSVEAARAYADAQNLQYAGKREQAIQTYLKAVELDPELARAYAGIATTYLNLGQRDKADRYFAMALARIHRMTDREKYRTRGLYYMGTHDYQNALAEFDALARQFPGDTAGISNLAVAYLTVRNVAKAIEYGRRAAQMYPTNVPYRNNVGVFLMYAGDFPAAEAQSREAIGMNPSFRKAYIVIALCALAQGNTVKAAETYDALAKIGGDGPSWSAIGTADLMLYEGRTSDAIALLQKQAQRDQSAGLTTPAATELNALGYAQLLAGHFSAAAQAAGQALAVSKDDDVALEAARIFVDAGQDARALAVARGFSSRLENAVQSYRKLIEGKTQIKKRPADGIATLAEANRLADTWLGHFELGRAHLEAKSFAEARAEFEQCWKRRGEATAVFLDEAPSYRFAPAVQYYLGRALEGLQDPAAADAYRRFLEMKKSADGDVLAADARRRLGSR